MKTKDFRCWVEVSPVTQWPCRIFRTYKAAASARTQGLKVARFIYKSAVEIIRREVFKRDKWRCTHCGEAVAWNTGHMHERQPRGKIVEVIPGVYVGGEISVENGTTLCGHCHLETEAGHGERRVRFGEA